jgi:SAM-dependent methyltransferase
MDGHIRAGFAREELEQRYDVPSMQEDAWHSYSDDRTRGLVTRFLAFEGGSHSLVLLNAGAGVHRLHLEGWSEVAVDIFDAPIRNHANAVCASVEDLPFNDKSFDAIVCIGEVLAYCDPAKSFTEFARVIKPNKKLICDFGNSRSPRHWMTAQYGKAAALVTVDYNGTPERTWVYDPAYISKVLRDRGFVVRNTDGIHRWSTFARRVGLGIDSALSLERLLSSLPLGKGWSDTMMVVADRAGSA